MSRIELRPKKALSALDLKALLNEVTQLVVGGSIINVYVIGHVLMLKVRCQDRVTRLLTIRQPQWVTLSKYDVEKPLKVSSFCKLLRKYLRRSRIVSLEQLGFDRVLRIDVEKGGEIYRLIVELVREGNVILCNGNFTILKAYKEVEYKDRIIKRGVSYRPPPNLVLDLSEERGLRVLSEAKRSTAFYFALSLVGSPEVAYEVLVRSGIDPEVKISRVDGDAIRRIMESSKSVVDSLSHPKPNIVYVDGKPFSVVPIEFMIYERYEKKYYSSFYEAIADFFYEALKEAVSMDEIARKEEERLRVTIEELKKRINELNLRIENLKKVIDFIQERYEEFQDLLNEVVVKGKEGIPTLSKLSDVEILEVDPRENVVTLKIKDEGVNLRLNESLMKNMTRLYDELKRLKSKMDSSVKAMKDLEEKLTKLIEERKTVEEDSKSKIRVRREPKQWYERFLWFKSSDGFIVVAGRDATQNEVLVKKYLDDRDMFFHADIVGASAVVVKSEGKEVPQTTISEAAQFAACYSKAWKNGFTSIDVYWVYGSQVSKTPPSGEYLPKGSFMVRGHRSYLRGVELKVAIGLSMINEEVLIISGPPSAIASQAIAYVTLIPGDVDKTKIAARIAKVFNEKLRSIGLSVRVKSDDIVRVMPPGTVRMTGKYEK
ncbi:MAG: ribosome rescue protein RqcH [Candidatus Nezhaarchaeota archaeon]|nr:ribosome rescue protein RqcH [Candidatus Nezhaarchaeota archaeon]MDW8050199.1 ribosome rescue protein RqcH [Nitrososphaerota archaeon]